MSMPAVTLHQPWAWAIAQRATDPTMKDVENRGKPPPSDLIGREFAIHGGLTMDLDALEDIAEDFGVIPVNCALPAHHTTRDLAAKGFCTAGAVAAVATLAGWVQVCEVGLDRYEVRNWAGVSREEAEAAAQSRWNAGGPYLWLPRNVRPLTTPVMCRGAQGIWTLEWDVEEAVRAQLGEAAR